MKKLASMMIVVALAFSCVPVSLAAGGSMDNFQRINEYQAGQFVDVKSDDWMADYVKTVYEFGMMGGVDENHFKPNENVTVGQAVALASRLHKTYSGAGNKFEQTSPWYRSYVNYANSNKLIKSSVLDYDAEITRLEFAEIIVSALPEEELPTINQIANRAIQDVPNNPSVYRLYRAGVFIGSGSLFLPDSKLQRGELATIISRMIEKDLRIQFELKVDTEPPEFEYNTPSKNNSVIDYEKYFEELLQESTRAAQEAAARAKETAEAAAAASIGGLSGWSEDYSSGSSGDSSSGSSYSSDRYYGSNRYHILPNDTSRTVYITETGTKYHTINCQYVKKSCIGIPINSAIDSGFTRCSRCHT